jgi:hypothetical protein
MKIWRNKNLMILERSGLPGGPDWISGSSWASGPAQLGYKEKREEKKEVIKLKNGGSF